MGNAGWARLRRAAGEEVFDKHRERLIFAVSVHEIECWLLPLIYGDNKRTKISGCLEAMNTKLPASDRTIPKSSASKAFAKSASPVDSSRQSSSSAVAAVVAE